MKPINTLRRVVQDADMSAQMLAEIREGISNQSALINRKMNDLIVLSDRMLTLQQVQIEATLALVKALGAPGGGIDTSHIQKALSDTANSRPRLSTDDEQDGKGNTANAHLKQAGGTPLLVGEKTYNTSHPNYDVHKVRNYPGTIFNAQKPSKNLVFKELQKLAKGDHVADGAWESILKKAKAEVEQTPHVEQIFERKAYIERYMADLSERYQAHYVPAWVNMEDALFLYWLVRTLKPKTLVQTGLCNGLSSAFMMLALVNNGPDGRLYAVDMPPVFDPKDPAWTIKGKYYGIVIPEGRTSGWMMPDAYRDRFEVHQGDARKLLPQLIDGLSSVDMFYHDSDHTYNHMMFEFREAKRKLSPGGLIVADDISWSASIWDFADEFGVPSYNYKGSVGTAFF